MSDDLLSIRDLNVRFDTVDGPVHALRGISLAVKPGERVAIVGESGSGKSVTARAILGLLPERMTQVRGVIDFEGQSLTDAGARHVKTLRGRAISMIFQDPMAALNPVFRIREQFRAIIQRGGEGLRSDEIEKRMQAALRDVAVSDPERILDSYTFQLSGGLNQRVMIAMGLVNNPKLLIADEPGTALDVTVQEQTLRIMRRLSESHGTAILFISHNLGVVRQFAHRVYVMYAGKIVEEAPTADIFAHPGHPYTKALLASVPRLATAELPAPIDGSVPDLRLAREGCPFEPRCPVATVGCGSAVAFTEVGGGHRVACVRAAEPVA